MTMTMLNMRFFAYDIDAGETEWFATKEQAIQWCRDAIDDHHAECVAYDDNRLTIGTMFTGFGGVDVGAIAAGVRLVWGFEKDARIAAVANKNLGNHVLVADATDRDPNDLQRVDILHASPPCPNFSTAKNGRAETAGDLALADTVCNFIGVIKPRIFTLENVRAYRRSESWKRIENTLHENGYWVDVANVNAADYGVPQARRRMIVRAVRGGFVPYLPDPIAHVGWYSAVEDIIDEFPEASLAPWQLRSMPADVDSDLLVIGQNMSSKRIAWGADEPAPTITAGVLSKGDTKVVLLGNNKAGFERQTINHSMGDATAFTITATNSAHLKMLGGGRVVAFTPRGIARLMTFPDWYELPEQKNACRSGARECRPAVDV